MSSNRDFGLLLFDTFFSLACFSSLFFFFYLFIDVFVILAGSSVEGGVQLTMQDSGIIVIKSNNEQCKALLLEGLQAVIRLYQTSRIWVRPTADCACDLLMVRFLTTISVAGLFVSPSVVAMTRMLVAATSGYGTYAEKATNVFQESGAGVGINAVR